MSLEIITSPHEYRIIPSAGESLAALRQALRRHGHTELREEEGCLIVRTWEYRDNIAAIVKLHRLQHSRFDRIEINEDLATLSQQGGYPPMTVALSRRGETSISHAVAVWNALWKLIRENFEIDRSETRKLVFTRIPQEKST